jgi:shikimate kinase
MNPAPNLVLVGPMGAGKSSIGRRLAERFGLSFVDADREIEAHTGATVTTIFECEGEGGFRARECAALAELLAGEGAVIATGGGAVLDAGNRRLLRERGYVVYLHVDVDRQAARLARDRTRPLLAGDDRDAVLRKLAAIREPLYLEVADLRFDTNTLAPADAAARLGHLLETAWQRSDGAAQQTPETIARARQESP